MKATGIVRQIDHLGRVCLPKELRRLFRIANQDHVEFFVEDDAIVIKRFDAAADMDQLLDDFQRSMEMKGANLDSGKLLTLLDKVREMKQILAEGGKK